MKNRFCIEVPSIQVLCQQQQQVSHTSLWLHHSNTYIEVSHRQKQMHLLSAKLRTEISSTYFFDQISEIFFFLQCSTIRDLVISDFLWSHCCNVIVFRNLLGEVIARLQSHFGFHTYKMRMLHLQRASRFTAEKQHETAFTYSLLTTPFSSSSNFQSQGHQILLSI